MSRTPAAAPLGRDRLVDLVRAASIGAVVLGHWLVTNLEWDGSELIISSPLETVPEMWPLSWLLQVMPLFFLVGGFSNRRSWESTRGRGEGYAAFVDRRLHRLLLPTGVFVAILTAVAVALWPLDGGGLGDAAAIVFQPIWFLGIYVVVIALTPLTLRWHDRAGWRAPAILLGAVAVIDLVRFAGGVGWVGYLNVIVVWVLIHQVGYVWEEARLRPGPALATAAAGLGMLALLTAVGPYPLPMVGVPGAEVSNMNPPNLTIVALAAAQTGFLALAAPALRRWLERPRVWRGVVAVNLAIMTVFLWHQAALLTVSRAVLPLGVPQPEPGSSAWWLTRPAWLAAAALLLAAIVALVGRFERRPAPPPIVDTPLTRRAGVAAIALSAIGLLVLAGTTVTRLLEPQSAIGVRIVPAMGAVHLVVVAILVRGLHSAGVTRLRQSVVVGAAAVAALAAALALQGLTAAAAIEGVVAVAVLAVAAAPGSSSPGSPPGPESRSRREPVRARRR